MTLDLVRAQAVPDGALIDMFLKRRHGQLEHRPLRIGPNLVHTAIIRRDGSVEDLGISKNLLTNTGRDLWAAGLGQAAGQDGVATATSATSLTKTAAGWTVDGYKGWRVWCPVTSVGTSPVYGNILSNTATVLTIDQWWKADDTTGTTPASTNAFQILPANIFRFMGLTSDAGAASAADTALASEITTNGGARALATYAHTGGTATYTMTKAFSFSGTLTAIHKMGMLTGLTSGILGYETVLNLDATVGNGDTMTVTWTATLSG